MKRLNAVQKQKIHKQKLELEALKKTLEEINLLAEEVLVFGNSFQKDKALIEIIKKTRGPNEAVVTSQCTGASSGSPI